MASKLDDIIEAVNESTSSETFSVIDTLKSRTYPTEHVVLYTEYEAAYRMSKLIEQRKDMSKPAEVDAVDAEIAELRKQVEASALTFLMRGYDTSIIEAIETKVRQEFGIDSKADIKSLENAGDINDKLNRSFIAHTIVKVTNAAGAVDNGPFTADDLEVYTKILGHTQMKKLLDATENLSFASLYFEKVIDADF